MMRTSDDSNNCNSRANWSLSYDCILKMNNKGPDYCCEMKTKLNYHVDRTWGTDR